MTSDIARLPLAGGGAIAWRRLEGQGPEIVFLCGLRSDMEGSKALFLEDWCRREGRAFTRFDYRGHGSSTGRFEEGCIGDWLADTLAVLDRVVQGRFVLVGSSMGGWLAVLAGLARNERLAGMVGIAAAPDFTADLMEARLSPAQRAQLAEHGFLKEPSPYGEPLRITRRLLEDGRRHRVLQGPIPLRCPVHLLQGQEDPDVPWETALRLAARLESEAVTVELVKDGDHRLSRDADLRRLAAAVERVLEQAAGR
ncbi:alpha/beta hydrolase [Marinimicrococcus flavescens]|uniref:Palmitoyl-protein thioesterase ABHD10, mitochondrial n=1 Tax=Marinimicrococcus flavescens TaxID=3031815 RepID=A0AAP4D6L6_9PROT|nr:alpha/beta hydrolase [Marinimicrococcus flavescens]